MPGNGGNGDGVHGPEAEQTTEDALVALAGTVGNALNAVVDTVGDGMRFVGQSNLEASKKVAGLLLAGITAQGQRIDALEARTKRLEMTVLELLQERAERKDGLQ
jgi:hypothetical protein